MSEHIEELPKTWGLLAFRDDHQRLLIDLSRVVAVRFLHPDVAEIYLDSGQTLPVPFKCGLEAERAIRERMEDEYERWESGDVEPRP